MSKSIGAAVGVFAVLGIGGIVAARTAPQQGPRDRTATQQHDAERAASERKVTELERAAAQQPGSAQAQHLVATFLYEKARDQSLAADERRGYLERGIAAEDRALAADAEYVEALVYKNILLRTRATLESDPAVREELVRQADALRSHALELQQHRVGQAIPEGTVVSLNTPAPPPPPPPPGGVAEPIKWVYAETEVTAVGTAPAKTKDVRPIYAPMVIASGYKGDVVLEANLDGRGKVHQVRVMKSVPMLTQATIDAVRQWEFDPKSVSPDGAVITVTATFTPPAK
jgi:TonB family protein